MSNTFSLNRTFTIGGLIGRTVVFLADEFALQSKHTDAVELQPAKGKLPAAWLSDEEIRNARAFIKGEVGSILETVTPDVLDPDSSAAARKAVAKNKKGFSLSGLLKKPKGPTEQAASPIDTGAAVYGFWSTALYNNLVSLDAPLTVAPFNESSGLYLVADSGVVVDSGLYVGSYIPGAALDLQSAQTLDVSDAAIRKWKAPPYPALSISEKVRLRKRQSDLRLFRLMGALGANLVVAFLLYQFLDSSATDRINRQSTAAQQSTLIESAIPALKINKLSPEKYPDTESLVALIAVQQLYYATRDLKINWDDFSSPEFKEFSAIASQPMMPLSFPHQRLQKADGTLLYTWPRANAPGPAPVAAAPPPVPAK